VYRSWNWRSCTGGRRGRRITYGPGCRGNVAFADRRDRSDNSVYDEVAFGGAEEVNSLIKDDVLARPDFTVGTGGVDFHNSVCTVKDGGPVVAVEDNFTAVRVAHFAKAVLERNEGVYRAPERVKFVDVNRLSGDVGIWGHAGTRVGCSATYPTGTCSSPLILRATAIWLSG
jgi:hypothetical protein